MRLLHISAVIALALAPACKERAKDSTPTPAPAPAPTEAAHGSAEPGHAGEPGHAAEPGRPAMDWPAPPANAVQTEMRLLTEVLAGSVRAIGLGDVRPIEHELHKLHEAKANTEAALKAGYKLPKNPTQLEAFEQMDNAFHTQLEALAKASQANDVGAAADALGTVVKGCNGCHAMFRK